MPVDTGRIGCGGVWMGEWADRREWMTRNDHWPRMAGERTVVAMQLTTSTRPTPHLGSLIGGTLLGALFVTAGLLVAYLTLETPFVAQLVPGSPTGPSPVGFQTAIWSFALIAGGALLVAGTNRLAITVAHLRSAGVHVSVVARALQGSTLNLAVVRDVTPSDGRVIPELVIGPFGAVVIHELPRPDVIRPASAPTTSWEIRTSDGWWPTEHPLDRAARDADRVRRWFADGDLGFVVRVCAAVVAPDGMLARSPAVAVIRADQIQEWLAALPGQRSLTVGRRERLLALVRTASGTSGRTARR